MQAIRNHSVKGISGREYKHAIYFLEKVDKLCISGVYIVYKDNGEMYIPMKVFTPLYVGIAVEETIAERFSGGHGEKTSPCFEENGARFIGVISATEKSAADEIEVDLIKGLNPECNSKHKLK